MLGVVRLWPAVAEGVTRRPGLVLAATAVVLAALAAPGLGIHYVYDALTDLAPDYGSVRGREMVNRHWPAGQAGPITILLAQAPDGGADLEGASRRLTSTLDIAKPGDRILMVSYGSGAGSDAFIWTVTERLERVRDLAPKTRDQLDHGKMYLDYGTYAKFRGKIHLNE